MTFLILREAAATYPAIAPNCGDIIVPYRNDRSGCLQQENCIMTYVVIEPCINCRHAAQSPIVSPVRNSPTTTPSPVDVICRISTTPASMTAKNVACSPANHSDPPAASRR